MDGRVCCRANVFVERLWKSVRYEEVYLYAYDTVSAAKQGLACDLTFYNRHSCGFNSQPHGAKADWSQRIARALLRSPLACGGCFI
jgi:hypothetical protein